MELEAIIKVNTEKLDEYNDDFERMTTEDRANLTYTTMFIPESVFLVNIEGSKVVNLDLHGCNQVQ